MTRTALKTLLALSLVLAIVAAPAALAKSKAHKVGGNVTVTSTSPVSTVNQTAVLGYVLSTNHCQRGRKVQLKLTRSSGGQVDAITVKTKKNGGFGGFLTVPAADGTYVLRSKVPKAKARKRGITYPCRATSGEPVTVTVVGAGS